MHDAVRVQVRDRRDDLRCEPLRTALGEAVERAELLEEVATWSGLGSGLGLGLGRGLEVAACRLNAGGIGGSGGG